MKKGDVIINKEGKTALVKWVMNNEAGVEFESSLLGVVIYVESEDWKMHEEVAPSYQSAVENMTTEELRESINNLRNGRALLKTKVKSSGTKKAKVVKEVMSDEDRAMIKMFGAMTPEQLTKLKQTLKDKAGKK